jgi:predicted CopG family antitoxin
VPSKTVSLESSAYERLRAAKAPDESFSETVNRILADSRPSYRVLAGVLTTPEAKDVRTAIRQMRAQEVKAERVRLGEWRRRSGRRARQ